MQWLSSVTRLVSLSALVLAAFAIACADQQRSEAGNIADTVHASTSTAADTPVKGRQPDKTTSQPTKTTAGAATDTEQSRGKEPDSAVRIVVATQPKSRPKADSIS